MEVMVAGVLCAHKHYFPTLSFKTKNLNSTFKAHVKELHTVVHIQPLTQSHREGNGCHTRCWTSVVPINTSRSTTPISYQITAHGYWGAIVVGTSYQGHCMKSFSTKVGSINSARFPTVPADHLSCEWKISGTLWCLCATYRYDCFIFLALIVVCVDFLRLFQVLSVVFLFFQVCFGTLFRSSGCSAFWNALRAS